MMPPAMRKADRLTPSALSIASPTAAKTNRMIAATSTARIAIDRRCIGVAPLVRPA